MKTSLQNTGTGVTVFAILALALCLPGTAGSKSEPSVFPPSLRLTPNYPQHRVRSKATAKLKKSLPKSNASRKQRLAATAYFWYVMKSKAAF